MSGEADSDTLLAFSSFCGFLWSHATEGGLILSLYRHSECASTAQAGGHAPACQSVNDCGNWLCGC